MQIKFTGGAGVLTGSCHLITYNDKNILLDCGLFQGKAEVEKLNEEDFPFDPKSIDYVILSHAHIDHSGRIPLLVKKGFRGRIYASSPTYDLCTIMLMDSAHIQETEAEWKTRKALRKGEEPLEPLYTKADAEKSLNYFKPVIYGQYEEIDDILTMRFLDAGHILGSSIVEMWFKENGETRKLVFSGDIGMTQKPIIRDPQIVEKADYLILESTYGNRFHDSVEERVEKLAITILDTIKKNGTVVIPAFAVGRTQEIIYELNEHYDGESEFKKEFSKVPVYIDSPLASKATDVFKKNAHVFDAKTREKIMSGDNPLEFKNLHFTQSVDESKALNASTKPKVIISASGMCNAGRIRHHLKHNLWRENATVVFIGYQAEGTLGKILKEGAKSVKLFGEDVAVNANIVSIEGFSGHADQEGLLKWVEAIKEKPKKIFLVHGEQEAKLELSEKIAQKFNIETHIPQMNAVYRIEGEQVSQLEEGYLLDSDEIEKKEFKKDKKLVLDDRIKEFEAIIETIERSDEEMIEADKRQALLHEIEALKDLADEILTKTEDAIENKQIRIKNYKQLNNLIKELEKTLVNLSLNNTQENFK